MLVLSCCKNDTYVVVEINATGWSLACRFGVNIKKRVSLLNLRIHHKGFINDWMIALQNAVIQIKLFKKKRVINVTEVRYFPLYLSRIITTY